MVSKTKTITNRIFGGALKQPAKLGQLVAGHSTFAEAVIYAKHYLRATTLCSIEGQIGKCECQFTCHGMLSLTISWDVVLGQMIQTTIGQIRNSEDFVRQVAQTNANASVLYMSIVCASLHGY